MARRLSLSLSRWHINEIFSLKISIYLYNHVYMIHTHKMTEWMIKWMIELKNELTTNKQTKRKRTTKLGEKTLSFIIIILTTTTTTTMDTMNTMELRWCLDNEKWRERGNNLWPSAEDIIVIIIITVAII